MKGYQRVISSMRSKRGVLLVTVLVIIGFSINFYIQRESKNQVAHKQDQQSANTAQLTVDFKGDGKPIELKIQLLEGEYKVHDSSGKELVFNNAAPFPGSMYKVVTLNEKSKKEYIQWDNPVSPNTTQTFFYTLFDGNLQALPAYDFENDVYTYAFYNSRAELGVGDFTSDGLVEVVESANEYPADAPLPNDPKIEKEFKEAFIKEGLTEELANDMAQIYKRDTYGKGGVVIWSIYSFLESEAPFFRKLNDDEYNEIADRYVTAMNKVFKETSVDSKLMKVSDLKQDSIDFNKFSKNVLTSGNNYEFPIEE
jgi:hypothetical protein